jgi:hypothetical protein
MTDPKKRKTQEEETGEEKQSQLYVERLKAGFQTFRGKEELMRRLFDDPTLLAGLQDSYYTPDLSSEAGLLYVPDDVSLTIVRNSQGVISQLKFADNSVISGTILRKLSIVLALKSNGYTGLVWDTNEKHKFAGLAFKPCNVYASGATVVEGKRSPPLFTAYYQKSIKSNYARVADLKKVLGIKEVTLSDMKGVMAAMSQLTSVAPETKFEEPSLDYAINLLKTTDIKRLTSTYATTLIGVFVKTSPLVERVKAFADYGSTATFGQTLMIPRPYAKDLFSDDLNPLDKMRVNELTDNDEVVCSTLPISAQFHRTVKLTDFVQIKPEGNYGVKNNKKLQTGIDTMIVKGDIIRTIVESITNSRKVSVCVGATLDADSAGESDDDVEI